MPPIAYLGLGSNLGDREANLRQAISLLVAGGLQLVAESSVYETDPVDFLDQPQFLNQVIAVNAERFDPISLLRLCLETEVELGRVRTVPRGARTIDIDLLLFGDHIISATLDGIELTLPHPRMHLRRFVLQPLAEIAPQLTHPVMQQTVEQLLASLPDDSAVSVFRHSQKP
jgi:2-amino-4-hydroxy-6-hydroxymethyldihydropteridine diphosphokinase